LGVTTIYSKFFFWLYFWFPSLPLRKDRVSSQPIADNCFLDIPVCPVYMPSMFKLVRKKKYFWPIFKRQQSIQPRKKKSSQMRSSMPCLHIFLYISRLSEPNRPADLFLGVIKQYPNLVSILFCVEIQLKQDIIFEPIGETELLTNFWGSPIF